MRWAKKSGLPSTRVRINSNKSVGRDFSTSTQPTGSNWVHSNERIKTRDEVQNRRPE